MHSSASCQPAQNSQMNNETKTGSLSSQTEGPYPGTGLQVAPVKMHNEIKFEHIIIYMIYMYMAQSLNVRRGMEDRGLGTGDGNPKVKGRKFMGSGIPKPVRRNRKKLPCYVIFHNRKTTKRWEPLKGRGGNRE